MNKILSIKSVKKSEYSYIAFVGAALILLGLMIALASPVSAACCVSF